MRWSCSHCWASDSRDATSIHRKYPIQGQGLVQEEMVQQLQRSVPSGAGFLLLTLSVMSLPILFFPSSIRDPASEADHCLSSVLFLPASGFCSLRDHVFSPSLISILTFLLTFIHSVFIQHSVFLDGPFLDGLFWKGRCPVPPVPSADAPAPSPCFCLGSCCPSSGHSEQILPRDSPALVTLPSPFCFHQTMWIRYP